MKRVEMLSESFAYQTVNNSLQIYGETYGARKFMWVTNPGESKTGPCQWCASKNGNIYRVGQFLPRMPAHVYCVCQWLLLFEESSE